MTLGFVPALVGAVGQSGPAVRRGFGWGQEQLDVKDKTQHPALAVWRRSQHAVPGSSRCRLTGPAVLKETAL